MHKISLLTLIVFALFLIVLSCGLPSVRQRLDAPVLFARGLVGDNIKDVDIPAGSNTHTGLIIMYKLFVNPTESTYESEYNRINNETNGEVAFQEAEKLHYRPLQNGDSVSTPTIDYRDIPTFFDADSLLRGITSSTPTSNKRISLEITSDSGFRMILESPSAEDYIDLHRNVETETNKGFYPFNAETYAPEDSDLQHLGDSTISSISSDDTLHLSLIVFTFAVRKDFGSNDSYSSPYILRWSELLQIEDDT